MAESEENGRGDELGVAPDTATLEVIETQDPEGAIPVDEPIPQALPILPMREMDALFGDWPGRALAGARSSGFSPKVDVYYCGNPQRAIVKADLAGVELSAVTIEISGRELAISGERPLQET